jgi:hypothetical protein
MAHAKLSPSAAERWIACPGSIALCDRLGIKSSPPTRFSAEGTFAHSIRAEALTTGADVASFIGRTGEADGFEFECSEEMAAYLAPGIERLRQEASFGRLHVEVKICLDPWVTGSFGTADAVVVADRGIIVDDLKYGAGLPVTARDNPQLMAYAIGALDLAPKSETVTIRIDQPRVAGGGGTWETTADELRRWGREVLKPAAEAAMQPDAPLAPSEAACRWCPAKAQCPALSAHSLEIAGFTDLTAPRLPLALTPEQRSVVLRYKGQIEGWLDALHSAALADALAGLPVPGFKAVEGRRGNRAWISPETLGPEFDKTVKMSPAEAEKAKVATKAAIAALVTQPDGKPCLVPDTDKRPAITTANAFDVIEAETPWE